MAMLDWLATATLMTSLAIALVLILRLPLARLAGPATTYALWLVVPVCLLGTLMPIVAAPPAGVELPTVSITGLAASSAPSDSGGTSWGLWLLLAWMAGTTLMLLRLLAQALAARLLITGSDPLPTALSAEAATTGLALSRFRRCHDITTPMVAGLWRPVVLVPPNMHAELDSVQQRLVLAHEACHAQRRDNLANLLAGAVLAVFWFNPLAWPAYRAYRSDQELSCDEAALADARPAEQASYGHALLTLSTPECATWLTTPWLQPHSTRRRLLMIKHNRPSTPARTLGVLIVISATALSFLAGAAENGDNVETETTGMAEAIAPLVRIGPKYPAEAAEAGIGGHVEVEFTVTEDGRVEDIVVLNSEPAGVFDAVTIEALKRWRFKPQIVDGTPYPRRATQKIEFDPDHEHHVVGPANQN